MIETERLKLVPLNAQQLEKWIYDIAGLEKELNCIYKAEPMEGIFLDIVKYQLEETKKDESNYVWHSFWFMIRKSDNVVIGAADFKDVADAQGNVEIGYGLGKDFEHNGYMTECVKAMCDFALSFPSVKHVIAETEIDGTASINILKRCGFCEYKRNETLWWKL